MQFLLLIASLASTASIALAAPSGWSPDTAKFYSAVAKEIKSARGTNKNPAQSSSPTCDFSKARLPSTDEPLPPVPEGQKLLHVTIGRGIQNYTCSSSSSTDKPKATGALATLFDATCLAATYPFLLPLLPRIALHLSNPLYPQSQSSPLSLTFGPTQMPITGYHFFDSAGVPVFDLLADGHASVAKIAGVPAPKGASKGVGKQMFGAVPWLYLAAVEGSTGKAKSVYRVGTAGGKAPETCEGWKGNDGNGGVLSVEYAAEYWFFG
ncbi:hypothetical protein EMCG_08558 [[Emmonsia] crescens]|uniref:Malate dehydrogenase n=1 Tax=[Emmonsia] crescens TaxID=73230 RepID=A0A0G2J471_9EURO|nr:hypothetical protein EMCG_08558 [Emmonsia crescens UAMH 3008]